MDGWLENIICCGHQSESMDETAREIFYVANDSNVCICSAVYYGKVVVRLLLGVCVCI